MMINKQFLIKEFQELIITSGVFNYVPSSPVTVLTMDQHDLCDIPQGDINYISNANKRKRER
uniref:Uncharacterized protein n=2 Tax=Solanum tuberosum TaxID=4113 RepID=M1AHJ8_SOLTU